MTRDEERAALIAKYPAEIEAFKEFCMQSNKPELWTEEEREELGDEPYEEIDFYGLSLGFFIAKGVKQSDAFYLATTVRYHFQYWC
jgi:hypothetical protein